jgi:hypothetical protein
MLQVRLALVYREGIQLTYQVFPDLEKKTPEERDGLPEQIVRAREFLVLTCPGVPAASFPALRDFAKRAGLPSFVFNTTVAPPRPSDAVPLRDRVFELGSIGFGSDSCGYLAWEDTEKFGYL